MIKFIFALMLFIFNLKSQPMNIMSYNIKYDNAYDTLNSWALRKHELINLISKHNPSILGIQEALSNQVEFITKKLNGYSFVGVGREDGKSKGEYAPIFYNEKEFLLISSNTFWLSENPNNVSVGWDASQERICTYALFEIRSNRKRFFVFNTHFDHKGAKARLESANLILSKIKDINRLDYACILMGDFNATEDKEPIKIIKSFFDDSHFISNKGHYGSKGTFNGFIIDGEVTKKIDYIFTKKIKVIKHTHIDDKLKSGRHISDHFPVLAQINM